MKKSKRYIALITDFHFGVRNDNQTMHQHFATFLQDVFFPTIDKYRVSTVINMGDLFDRRKYSNHNTLNWIHENYVQPSVNRGLVTHLLLGNHDIFYRNTNDVNTPSLFLKPYVPDYFLVYDKPQIVKLSVPKQTHVLMLPWIPEGKQKTRIEDLLSESQLPYLKKCQYAFGHLEMSGFSLIGNVESVSTHDDRDYSQFTAVYSGHYHMQQIRDNIHYIGTPYQMEFHEWNMKKGFYLLNEDDLSDRIFIENPNAIFHHFDVVNGSIQTTEQPLDKMNLKGCFIKLHLKDMKSVTMVDQIIDNLYAIRGVANIDVLDEATVQSYSSVSSDDLDSASEETIDIIQQTVAGLNPDIYSEDIRKQITKSITQIFQEAISEGLENT